MTLSTQIESILFFKGEAVSFKVLSDLLEKSESEISEALDVLKNDLQDRGIRLIRNNGRVMLGTAPEISDIIEKIKKEELSKDLGKASLETLSIILYRGPIRKAQIDYIRGVNSGSILRNLLVRGLIEKKADKESQRSFLYYPTFELLSFLGISKLEELPEYEKVRGELEKADEEDKEVSEVENADNNE